MQASQAFYHCSNKNSFRGLDATSQWVPMSPYLPSFPLQFGNIEVPVMPGPSPPSTDITEAHVFATTLLCYF